MKDTFIQSAIRGRIGSAVLAVVAALSIIFGLSPDEQQAAATMTNDVMQWIAGGSALGSGILAAISKLREKP